MAEIPVNLLEPADARIAFIGAATWHGTLDEAEAILAAHPWLAGSDIHTAAILGDDEAVRRFIAADAANVTRLTGPYGADALVCLGLSKYLRLDKSRSENFVRAATALLDAGANPNSGFWSKGQYPEFENALYGAAGVAHHAPLTRLLVERGADPNDVEVMYHSPETYDNDALVVLLESGKLTQDSLACMLLRKADWHDYEGMKLLLEHGADPNRITMWGFTALHQALRRDNDLKNIAIMLEHGADPGITTQITRYNQNKDMTATSIAARRGRGDVLALFKSRGIPVATNGIEGLIAACAQADEEAIQSIRSHEPETVKQLVASGGKLLAEFAGTGNTKGIACLLNLGVDINTLYEGDAYFDTAKNSTALHVAAWRARHDALRFLIAQGATINRPDGRGRSPLMLAVRACVDSYWVWRRTPESVEALLEAGASVKGVQYPCGYDEVDELLKKYGA